MRKTSFLKKKLYVVVVGIALVVVVLGYVAYRFFIKEGLNANEKEKVKRYKEYIVKHRNALKELITKYVDEMKTEYQRQLLNESTQFAFEDDIDKIDDPNKLLQIRQKVIQAEKFMREIKSLEKPAAETQTVAQTQVM